MNPDSRTGLRTSCWILSICPGRWTCIPICASPLLDLSSLSCPSTHVCMQWLGSTRGCVLVVYLCVCVLDIFVRLWAWAFVRDMGVHGWHAACSRDVQIAPALLLTKKKKKNISGTFITLTNAPLSLLSSAFFASQFFFYTCGERWTQDL